MSLHVPDLVSLVLYCELLAMGLWWLLWRLHRAGSTRRGPSPGQMAAQPRPHLVLLVEEGSAPDQALGCAPDLRLIA
jgi:hypothetical protein